MPRYRTDATLQRFGDTLIGGSPLRLFRLTRAGNDVIDTIEAGEVVERSKLVDALVDAGAIHPAPEAGPFGSEHVTIVVPTLGPPPHPPSHAVVVDDGSDPALHGATIRLATNQGPGAARNAGLAQVTTPLVAFVDSDVSVVDGWLDALLPHFADECVALVAPRVRSADGNSPWARYDTDHSPLDLGDQPARVRAGSRVSYVPAAAIVCRASALREIGGFDTGLRFGEDVDLVWRLDRSGWRCRYEPSSEVVHAPRATGRSWARQRIDYGSSAAPLARRHPGALAPVRMSPWSALVWILVFAGEPILGALTAAGAAAALARKLPQLPPRISGRLALIGTLRAGDQLGRAVRRAWWPVVAVAATRSRTARRVAIAAAFAARRPMALADDLAYSVGVWRGVLTERTWGPLVPDLSSWPRRSRDSPAGDR